MPTPLSDTGSLTLPVQRALYAALTQNVRVMAAVSGIFDAPPEGQAFPYIVLDTAVEVAENTLTHLGRNIIFLVDVWSQAVGFTEALTVAELVIRGLDHYQLALERGTAWRCQFEGLRTMRDPDGFTRHVRISFRIGVQF